MSTDPEVPWFRALSIHSLKLHARAPWWKTRRVALCDGSLELQERPSSPTWVTERSRCKRCLGRMGVKRGQKNSNARRQCRGCKGWMRWGGAKLVDGVVSTQTPLERAQPPADHLCVDCAADADHQLPLFGPPK